MAVLQQHFNLALALAIGWLALVIGGSVLYRLARGKPLFRPRFDRPPRFLETWRSGTSLRSLITRIGGARSCLWVAVTDDALLVSPHFPFNLMFLPEIYGLDLALRGEDIRSVERRQSLFGNRVRIRFARAAGAEAAIDLWLRDADGFVGAVESIRRTSRGVRGGPG